MKKRLLILLHFVGCFISLQAQEDTTSSGFNLNNAIDGFKESVDQFFDIQMLDHSIQTRRMVKDGLNQSLHDFNDKTNGQLILALKSKLNIAEVWPNMLNRKKFYSIDGKYNLDSSFNNTANNADDSYFIVLNIDVDTLSSRNEYGVTITGHLDPQIEAFLIQKGITGLKTDIDNHFIDYFGSNNTFTKPGDAPVADAIIALFTLLDDKLDSVYDELLEMQAIANNISETFPNANEGFKVVFSPDPNQAYGFDVFRYAAWANNYDFVQLGDGKIYKTPVKSLKEGIATEKVIANFIDSSGTGNGNNISFRDKNNNPINFSKNGSEFTLTLPASSKGLITIYAFHNDDKIGKLQVRVYKEKAAKVVIVPVNTDFSVDAANLQSYLNDIYKKAIVNWEVEINDRWNNNVWDVATPNKLEAADANLMQKYSPEMRELRNIYFDAHPDYDKKAYYLFVISDFTNINIQGYMVRGKNLGFVENNDALVVKRTIAHELGHGAFGLRHTFAADHKIGDLGQTLSLMDYASTTHLSFPEWKTIHSWLPVNSMFDSEEDGEGIFVSMDIPQSYRNADSTVSFWTPSNKIITLPKEVSYVNFFTADPLYYRSTGEFSGNYGPIGTISGFRIQESFNTIKKYKLRKTGSTIKFLEETTEEPYVDSLTKESATKTVTAFPFREGNNFTIQIYNLDVPSWYSSTIAALPDSGVSNFGNNNENYTSPFSIIEMVYSVEQQNSENIISLPMAAGTTHVDIDPSGWNQFFESKQGHTVNGQFYPTLTGLSIEYLDYYSSYTKIGHPAAPIVIANAIWVQKMEMIEAYIKCAVINNSNIPANDPTEPLGPSAFNGGFMGYSWDIAPPVFSVWDYHIEETPWYTPLEQYQHTELGKAIAAYHSFKDQINILISASSSTSSINDQIANVSEGDNDAISEMITSLENASNCALEELTMSNRVKAIKLLEPWNEEALIVKLVSTTQYNAQASALVSAILKDNGGSVYRLLWDRLHFTEFHQFIDKLTELAIYSAETTETPYSLYIGNDKGVDMSYRGISKYDNMNGTFTFTRSFYDNSDMISAPGSYVDRNRYFSDTYNYYDLIEVTFTHDDNLLVYDDTIPTKTMVVPAFYVQYLIYERDKGKKLRAVRVLANVVSILIAIPTGGASLSVGAAFMIAFDVADIIITVNEENINPTLLTAWNGVALIVAGGAITKGIYKVTTNVGTRFKFVYSELFQAMQEEIQLVKNVGKTVEQSDSYKLLLAFKQTYGQLKIIGKSAYAAILNTKLIAKLEAQIMKSRFTAKASGSKIIITDDIMVNIEENGAYYLIGEVKQSSQGAYLNTAISNQTLKLNEGERLVGHIEDTRYAFGSSVKQGDLSVIKGTNGFRVVEGLGGGFMTRVSGLNLTNLTSKINGLSVAQKTKFLDEFAEASDDALIALNNKTSLVDYWKNHGAIVKGRSYPNVGHQNWDMMKQNIISKADPVEVKILNEIENARLPDGNEKVMAGAYSPHLPDNDVVIRYNTPGFNLNSLEPELRNYMEYLSFIHNDFKANGKLFESLYSGVPPNKMMTANVPGIHAEVLATNEVIKQLKLAGKFSGPEDLNKIHVLVKGKVNNGRGWENMCRCPHCFQIINGVNTIGKP